VLDLPAVGEAEGVDADTTVEVGEAAGVRAVFGSVALQATKTKAAGSTHSALTQPVFALIKVSIGLLDPRQLFVPAGPARGLAPILAG